uniref:Uncharacterized protein n=1 Tax=Pararge aegeria TaxID=116150 RepID=S4PS47_9NEOP
MRIFYFSYFYFIFLKIRIIMAYLNQIHYTISSLIDLSEDGISISLERCAHSRTLEGHQFIELVFSITPIESLHSPKLISYLSGLEFLGLKLERLHFLEELIIPEMPFRSLIATHWTLPSNAQSSLFLPSFP